MKFIFDEILDKLKCNMFIKFTPPYNTQSIKVGIGETCLFLLLVLDDRADSKQSTKNQTLLLHKNYIAPYIYKLKCLDAIKGAQKY